MAGLGPLSACLGFSLPGALRHFFSGGWHAGGRGAGSVGAPLCSPCFLALWRLRPGPERKEAVHTSQVTGCLLGARPARGAFSGDPGFCRVPCVLRGSLWGVW